MTSNKHSNLILHVTSDRAEIRREEVKLITQFPTLHLLVTDCARPMASKGAQVLDHM